MKKIECLAMLLAGGQGSRLEALTKKIAKPGVSFGGKYRIIDFSLSNCTNSKIHTVGVLTQYRPLLLNSYIGTGLAWDLDIPGRGVSILPPYETELGKEWYKGTADAVYRNIDYININKPEYVLILSGDHIYRMDYREMLKTHKDNNADLTISVMEVPWDEASRFGIIVANDDGAIIEFAEKPQNPTSNLASMGIYIFSKDVLEKALIEDNQDSGSSHDFGKNIIPKLLAEGKRLFCHRFSGYWKDVGTIASYHETNMSLLDQDPAFKLHSTDMPLMSNANTSPPYYVGPEANVETCIIGNGSEILGDVKHSVLSTECFVGKNAVVRDSILLPKARIEEGAIVTRAIIGQNDVINANEVFGSADLNVKIAVSGNNNEGRPE